MRVHPVFWAIFLAVSLLTPAGWRIITHHHLPAQVVVQPDVCGTDHNGNGLTDAQDIVLGARREVERRTVYCSSYYAGGYPPEGEGACTDMIWRAFNEAGYDLKAMVDEDIRGNPKAYPRINGCPDPNIDFRRVPNLVVFFQRHAASLTTGISPGNPRNLKEWQGGDIIVYGPPLEHIGVVSDRRLADGVPLLIHNCGPYATEDLRLDAWPTPITHHFRFPGTHK